ncbi:NADPH-dependent FMN reductase (plasmid) [Streptomyces sp. BI20]|uniref:NADPH-dependent FMN reductase n=1 Tax=Streptomyces sp. BI20 TaxID=3403460 RepID=UPI003C77F6BB
MPHLQFVIASTRPGRVGPAVAAWAAEQARARGDFDVEVVDLAEIGLPLFDEPEMPATGVYHHEHTKRWSATVSRSDALVFVMPMYNGAFTAPLKNAVDFLHREWQGKPVGLFSYSAGPSGGAPAAEMIRPVLTRVGFRVAEHAVALPGTGGLVTPEGLDAPEGLAEGLAALLDELAKSVADTPAVPAGI